MLWAHPHRQNPENGLTTYLGYDCIGNLLGARDMGRREAKAGQ